MQHLTHTILLILFCTHIYAQQKADSAAFSRKLQIEAGAAAGFTFAGKSETQLQEARSYKAGLMMLYGNVLLPVAKGWYITGAVQLGAMPFSTACRINTSALTIRRDYLIKLAAVMPALQWQKTLSQHTDLCLHAGAGPLLVLHPYRGSPQSLLAIEGGAGLVVDKMTTIGLRLFLPSKPVEETFFSYTNGYRMTGVLLDLRQRLSKPYKR